MGHGDLRRTRTFSTAVAFLSIVMSLQVRAGNRGGERQVDPDRTLVGHTDGLHGVAFIDAGHAVSASHDGTLKVWDLKTGQALRTLEGHTGAVRCVAVSRDGKRVASGGDDKTARVWDATTGAVVAMFNGHTDSVSGIAFLPGDKLVTAGNEGALRLWDLNSEKELWRSEPDDCALSLAASADGRYAAYGDCFGQAHVFDLAARGLIGKFGQTNERGGGPVRSMAFAGDNRTLWFSGITLQRLDAATRVLSTVKPPNNGYGEFTLSPDGSLAVGGNGAVWDAKTSEALFALSGLGGGVAHFAIAADNRHVLAAGGGLYQSGKWKRTGSNDVYSFVLPDRNAPPPPLGPVSGSVSWEVVKTSVRDASGKLTPFAGKWWKGQRYTPLHQTWAICGGFEDAPSGRKPIDVLVTGGAILIHRDAGILDQVLTSPTDGYGTAVYDGAHFFVTSKAKGITVLDGHGKVVTTVGQAQGLPRADVFMDLHVLERGKLLVAAYNNDHKDLAGYCARVEPATDSSEEVPRFHANVFFRESQLASIEGGWAEKYGDTGATRELFLPRFITEPPVAAGQPRSVWVGCQQLARSPQPILRVDVQTLKVSTFNLKPLADEARLRRLMSNDRKHPDILAGQPGPVWVGPHDALAYVGDRWQLLTDDGGPYLSAENRRLVCVPNNRSRGDDMGPPLQLGDQLFLPGQEWYRFDRATREATDIGPGLRVDGQLVSRDVQYFVSGVWGLAAISATDGCLYRISVDPAHPLAVRGTRDVPTPIAPPAEPGAIAYRGALVKFSSGYGDLEFRAGKLETAPDWTLGYHLAEQLARRRYPHGAGGTSLYQRLKESPQDLARAKISPEQFDHYAHLLFPAMKPTTATTTPAAALLIGPSLDNAKIESMYAAFEAAADEEAKAKAALAIFTEAKSAGEQWLAAAEANYAARESAFTPEQWDALDYHPPK